MRMGNRSLALLAAQILPWSVDTRRRSARLNASGKSFTRPPSAVETRP